jgi:hypothetical protein
MKHDPLFSRRLAGFMAWVPLLLSIIISGHALAAGPAIKPFERQSLKTIEAARAAQGFWLVLWDLECVYCMESLQQLAAAQRKDPALRIVTVATDPIEETTAIASRLREIGVRSEAYAFGGAAPEALRFAIDPAWRGEKPRAYFYAAGGRRTAVTGVLTAQHLRMGRN